MSQISWESFPWKQLSLVNDEEVISLSHAKVYVFSDSVLCLGKMNQIPTSNTVWERQWGWFKDSSQYRTLNTTDGEPMEFEWKNFPGFTTFMSKMGEPEQFQGRIIFMSMLNDIMWRKKTMKRTVLLIPHLCLYSQNISSRTLVIPRTWVRGKVVFH